MKTRIIKILAFILSTICVFSCLVGCSKKPEDHIINGMIIYNEVRCDDKSFFVYEDETQRELAKSWYKETKEIDGVKYYIAKKEKTFLLSDYSSVEELDLYFKKYFEGSMSFSAFSNVEVNENEKKITMNINKDILYTSPNSSGVSADGIGFDAKFLHSSKNEYIVSITSQRKFKETSFGTISDDKKTITIVFTPDEKNVPDTLEIEYK